MLGKVEATLVPPPREWLQVIIDDGDDEAEAKEKALAEHVARHPLAGKRMIVFGWWEVPRRGGELPPERHLRVGPNNI